MMYKDRELDLSKPVEVYRNLTKLCFSVRQNGLVICHSQLLILKDAKYIVGENGRQRVIREKKKNVHAFVRGLLTYFIPNDLCSFKVTYDPYKYDSFIDIWGEKVKETDFALFDIDSRSKVTGFNYV